MTESSVGIDEPHRLTDNIRLGDDRSPSNFSMRSDQTFVLLDGRLWTQSALAADVLLGTAIIAYDVIGTNDTSLKATNTETKRA